MATPRHAVSKHNDTYLMHPGSVGLAQASQICFPRQYLTNQKATFDILTKYEYPLISIKLRCIVVRA